MNKDEGPSRATTPTDLIQRLGGDWFSSSGLCSFFCQRKCWRWNFFCTTDRYQDNALELIFARLDSTELENLRRVRQEWKDIIDNGRWWKKIYDKKVSCIHQIVIIETTSTLHFISAWFSIPVDSWNFIFLCVVPTDAIQIFAMARSGAIPRLRRARGFQQQLGSVLSGDVHEIQRIFKGKLLPRYQPPSLFPCSVVREEFFASRRRKWRKTGKAGAPDIAPWFCRTWIPSATIWSATQSIWWSVTSSLTTRTSGGGCRSIYGAARAWHWRGPMSWTPSTVGILRWPWSPIPSTSPSRHRRRFKSSAWTISEW